MAQNILTGNKPGKDTIMKKAIISRTIINNAACVTVFNTDTRKTDEIKVSVPAAFDTAEKAEKYLRRHPEAITGKLVMVSGVDRVEKLVGMYVDDFIKNAKQVTERNKETRGTVTKTVQTCVGTALYMTENRKVYEAVVTFPVNVTNVDNYIRKNCNIPGRYIEVVDIQTIDSLYSMDENTFITLAKPMKNKFQLAD